MTQEGNSVSAENIIQFPAQRAVSDDQPLMPPGEYLAVYESHYGAVVFQNKAPKVCIRMKLAEHPDVILERWYRVRDFRRGRIVANRSSDIVRELRDVLGRGVRYDRIPIGLLKGLYVRVEVRTVTQNYDQEEHSPNNQYSSICRLVAKVEP